MDVEGIIFTRVYLSTGEGGTHVTDPMSLLGSIQSLVHVSLGVTRSLVHVPLGCRPAVGPMFLLGELGGTPI